jgi:hypothetical protein
MDPLSYPCHSLCDTNDSSPRYTITTINNNSHNDDNSNDDEHSNSLRRRSDATALRLISETR